MKKFYLYMLFLFSANSLLNAQMIADYPSVQEQLQRIPSINLLS